jgi:hypothetical protein
MKERSLIKVVGSSRLSIPFSFFIFCSFFFLIVFYYSMPTTHTHGFLPYRNLSVRYTVSTSRALNAMVDINDTQPEPFVSVFHSAWKKQNIRDTKMPKIFSENETTTTKKQMNLSLLLQLNRKKFKLFDWIYSLLVCLFFVLLHPAEYLEAVIGLV